MLTTCLGKGHPDEWGYGAFVLFLWIVFILSSLPAYASALNIADSADEPSFGLQDITMDPRALKGGVPVHSIARPDELFGGNIENPFNPALDLSGLDVQTLDTLLSQKHFFRSVAQQSLNALQATESLSSATNIGPNSMIFALKTLQIQASIESSSIYIEFPE